MKTSCGIIRDLLPIYNDNVCSKESRELVEEHIKDCQECKSELEKYNIEIKGVNYMNQKANIEEAKPINTIAKKWKRDKKVSFLLGTGIVSILGCVFSILAYHLSPNYIAEDGMLVESFGFIPLTFLFGLIAVISIVSLGIISMVKYFKLK
jgi:hypothetical protein